MGEGQVLGPLVKVVSQRRIDAYSGVRPHSIHTDEAWAAAKGFRKPLAQGMMTTAYVSELMIGLLGRGFIEGGRMDVTFLAPVFADDVLTVGGVVSGVSDEGNGSSRRVEATVRATNGDGRTTMAGTASGVLLPADARPEGAAVGRGGGDTEFADSEFADTEFADNATSNRRRIDVIGTEQTFHRLAFDALVVGETFVSDDRLVRPEDLETYAFAVDDHHPWFAVGADPSAAVDSPYGRPIAHPTLLGNQALFLRHSRYVVPAGLHAKMSFEFLRPIRLGVRARSHGVVVDRYERRGRQFMVTEFETVDDATGEILVRGGFTQMLFPEPAAETVANRLP